MTANFCTSCGAPRSGAGAFCAACGTRFETPSTTATAPTAPAPTGSAVRAAADGRHRRGSGGGLLVGLTALALVVLLLVGGVIGSGAVLRALDAARASAERDSPEQVGAELDATAEQHPVFIAFKRDFPEDYQRFRADIVEGQRAGRTLEEQRQAAFDFMGRFVNDHWTDMAAADDATLVRFVSTQAEVMEAQRDVDVGLCGRMLRGQAELADAGGPSSPRLDRAWTDFMQAELAAIKAGRDHPVTRPEPTAGDVSALSRAMTARGASQAQIRAALDGGAEGTDAQVCDGVVLKLRALESLPAERTGRMVSAMMSATAADKAKAAD